MFYNVKIRPLNFSDGYRKGVVLPHQKREDGTWNVKIRVTHKRKCTYIDTEHFVNAKQLRKDHKIKDHFILDLLHPVLKEYRDKISSLGNKLSFYNHNALATYLQKSGQTKALHLSRPKT